MNYASANRRPNPAALVGALGIPGAFGALLVVGLAVTVVTKPAGPRIKGEIITETILPPPPPIPDKPQPDQKTTSTTTTSKPDTPRPAELPTDINLGETVFNFPVTGTPAGTGTGTGEIGFPAPARALHPSIPSARGRAAIPANG